MDDILGAAARAKNSCYVNPKRSKTQILFDQLEFLVDHKCGVLVNCPDCARLANIEGWLMTPWRKSK